MRRRQYEYSRIGDVSVRLYQAYSSYWGKIIDGVLKGGLATIVSSMSTEDVGDDKMASSKMLDFHAALGSIWFALVAKDYLEAANFHFKEIRENLQDLGVEIATYAKLKANEQQLSAAWADQSSIAQPLQNKVDDQVFVGLVNSDVIPAINKLLKENNLPEIALETQITADNFEEIVNQQVKYSRSLPTLIAGGLGLAATIAGAAAIASANPSALVPGIVTASVGAMTTSVAGATLAADGQLLKTLSRDLVRAVQDLSKGKFSVAQIEAAKEIVRKDKREIPEASELRAVISNPHFSRVAPQEEQGFGLGNSYV